MHVLFSSSTRRRHYVEALEVLRNRLKAGDVYSYALCILLGTIAYDHYFDSPWNSFNQLKQYYPELTRPLIAICQQEEDMCVAATKERIDILEKAISSIDQIK